MLWGTDEWLFVVCCGVLPETCLFVLHQGRCHRASQRVGLRLFRVEHSVRGHQISYTSCHKDTLSGDWSFGL